MLDRLYCPDFSAIFGDKFRNPYLYPKIDSLIWPTLIDFKLDSRGQKLLNLTQDGKHPLFYRRKISINELVLELQCSDLEGACVQAIDFNGEYGISSEQVLKNTEKYPKLLFPILSPLPTAEGIKKFEKHADKAVAAVVYPSYQNLNLIKTSPELEKICQICIKETIPLKIDLGNMYLPGNNQTLCTPEQVRSFVNKFPTLQFILSGIDLLGKGPEFVNLLRYERNCNIELDPRTFGGMTPEAYFTHLFQIPGAIQNVWGRIILGSSTPMLESSQVARGWWNATEKLPFGQQSILRTLGFRNINHLFKLNIGPTSALGQVPMAEPYVLMPPTVLQKGETEIQIYQDIQLESFSITQLLHISPLVEKIVNQFTSKYKDFQYGELIVRSFHTTTSLIVNEHEFGNYLELHYQLAEDTMAKAEDKLHTVAALENRADFNYPDHITATSRGGRNFIAPIVDGKIHIGGRENLYLLVTFGPRSLKINLSLKLFKADST